MLSMLAVPETISSSQARPRAMDLISAVRRSAFMGRARDLALEAGSRISLNRLAGGFVQGINSAEFSSWGRWIRGLACALLTGVHQPKRQMAVADLDASDHGSNAWLVCLRKRASPMPLGHNYDPACPHIFSA